MFSGIIKTLGTVKEKTRTQLVVRAGIKRPEPGASISINGCCLTVVMSRNNIHRFDVGPETLSRTNLGDLKIGQAVNVEPSLRIGDELGGHFVYGHVDAAAKILALEPWDDGFHRLRIELPKALRGLVAEKGSVAVDGVSLTVSKVGPKYFEIMLVPHTLKQTTLGRRRAGECVNLEADSFARYAHGGTSGRKRS
ncbi:MAG: riboflavin synthase [Elusimicrobia bacterium]|nr:riboflavin synthase [Elusimicrobiota bacterium]